jgi:hypothetical protein
MKQLWPSDSTYKAIVVICTNYEYYDIYSWCFMSMSEATCPTDKEKFPSSMCILWTPEMLKVPEKLSSGLVLQDLYDYA